MILSTLAAMADYADDGKFDLDVSQADILTKIQALNSTGNFPLVAEKLTIGNKVVMVRTAEALQLACHAVLNKTPQQTVQDDIINLQSSSSSSSAS